MNKEEMTSMQRVLTTLGHEEPDRVPLFLLLTTHGSNELNMSIEQYYTKPENIAQAQIKMRERYGNDCYYNFYYASLELEAWGGSTTFYENGSPNASELLINDIEDITSLEVPDVWNSPSLSKPLKSTEMIKEYAGEDVPIIGVVMSPFSLPIMQIGFDKYFDIMYEREDLFDELIKKNSQFCVDWGNAQLEAGATAICYFDPVSSSTIIPKEKYKETGYNIGKKIISELNGPVAIHMASGKSLPIIPDVTNTGVSAICTSVTEDLAEVKAACDGKISIIGNLNGIEMRNWTPEIAEAKVKEAIGKAAVGGGYILSDNHGEIPYQVPDEILMAISKAVQKYGKYPIQGGM